MRAHARETRLEPPDRTIKLSTKPGQLHALSDLMIEVSDLKNEVSDLMNNVLGHQKRGLGPHE